MANTITKQTLLDGDRNLVVKITIEGDGSGEESASSLIDISDYTSGTGRVDDLDTVRINCISGHLSGFAIDLLWDATTNVIIATYQGEFDDKCSGGYGGLNNPKPTGYTGDILFTTTGLGAGDKGYLILEMVKKYG